MLNFLKYRIEIRMKSLSLITCALTFVFGWANGQGGSYASGPIFGYQSVCANQVFEYYYPPLEQEFDNITWTVDGGGEMAWNSDVGTSAGQPARFSFTSNATIYVTLSRNNWSLTERMVISVTTPSVNLSGPSTICPGSPGTFTGTAFYSGTSPSFAWRINGYPIGSGTVSSNGNTSAFTPSTSINDQDVISVDMTVGDGGCSTGSVINSNGIQVTVLPYASSFNMSGISSICGNTSASFSAYNIVNGGASPTFQWKINGEYVNSEGGITIYNGGKNLTITGGTFSNNFSVTCEMTSNASCHAAAPPQTINVAVQPPKTLTAGISFPGNHTFCEGDLITFNASTNSAVGTHYTWMLNGTGVGGDSNSFATAAITQPQGSSNILKVTITSSESCLASNSVSFVSNIDGYLTISPVATPQVTLSVTNATICYNQPATFSASPSPANRIGSPNYVWKVNGAQRAQGSSPTISNSSIGSLVTGDMVSVFMTVTGSCLSSLSASSNSIQVIVPDPTTSFNLSGVSSICSSNSATFSAYNIVNGGSSPNFQWRINNEYVNSEGGITIYNGGKNLTIAGGIFSSNFSVTCEMTSNASCHSAALPQTINVTVQTPKTLTAGINVPGNYNFCEENPITFNASTNSTVGTHYSWTLNGSAVGGDSNSFITTSITQVQGDNNILKITVTSAESCLVSNSVSFVSNIDSYLTILPVVTPQVSLSVTNASICYNQPVIFIASASPTNRIGSPNYVWKVNGAQRAQGSSPTISSSSIAPLVTGDLVSVFMTVTGSCLSSLSASSNGIQVTVPDPASSFNLSGLSSICSSNSVTFSAFNVVNGGPSPNFQWKINDEYVNNEGGITISNSGKNLTVAGGTYSSNFSVTCEMMSNSPCHNAASPQTINVMVEIPKTLTAGISVSGNHNFCEGDPITFNASTNSNTGTHYLWALNGSAVGGDSNSFTTTSISGIPGDNTLTLEVTSGGCLINTSINAIYNLGNLTIATRPVAPVTQDTIVLYNATKALHASGAGNNQTYHWYNSSGNYLNQGLVFTTDPIVQNITFLVSIYNSVSNCESVKTSLNVSVNHPPIVNAGPDQVVTVPVGSVVFEGTATDQDGFIISTQWAQLSGPPAYLSGANTPTLTIINPNGGNYSFRFTATDNNHASSFDDVNLNANYPLNNYNWIREETISIGNVADPSAALLLKSDQKILTVNYIDGFGRASQTIGWQRSPSGKDIVQPSIYDVFGREKIKYLPFVSSENDGLFKKSPVVHSVDNIESYVGSPHYNFYNSNTSNSNKIINDAMPYAETIYEPSPLNRIVKQGAPGAVWQPTADPSDLNDHSIKKIYSMNVNTEVYQFLYYSSTGLVRLSATNSGFYTAGQLFSNKTFDENNNDVIEYVDKEGRVVCKKVKAGTTAYASTYYVYDDFGNLIVVLPPEGVNSLVSSQY